ncbi:unnamed protein product, partial [Mesorhabditis belari]|uniref:CN hydrolase domain-containing protein n=1 Tax=Mesorhabditis belari TaxID=2138241 RepID=A0AAF3EBB8_9BILA
MKVSIVQAGSFIYDTPRTLDLLEKLTREAANEKAELILFPEAFIGGYPKWNDFGILLGSRSQEGREEFQRYYDSAITENGSEAARVEALAKELQVFLVTGVVERDGGTLYCSVFFYSPTGYLGKHRKLLPTALERCVWGNGDGSTMKTFDTEIGKLGTAICWENYMPLYRTYLYSQGIQLYLAPTVDDRPVWLPTMQTIALEGRCFVISAVQYMKGSNYPEGHSVRLKHGDEKHGKGHSVRLKHGDETVFIRGGSCIVDPLGKVLVAPEFDGQAIKYADIDLNLITQGKFDLDVVGHYARNDIFKLIVDTREQKNVVQSKEA